MNPEFDKILEEKARELGLSREELEGKLLDMANGVETWSHNMKEMSAEEFTEELGKLQDPSQLWLIWLAFLFNLLEGKYNRDEEETTDCKQEH